MKTVCGAHLVLAVWLVAAAGSGYAEAASPPSEAAIAATLKRDSARCRSRSDLDACYDAVRRNPGDSSLSVALGDALVREKRPADALRSYRRAATLSPNSVGLAAKISALEAPGAVKRNGRGLPVEPTQADRTAAKRFSNLAIEGQSH